MVQSSRDVKRLFDDQTLTSGTPIGATLQRIALGHMKTIDEAKGYPKDGDGASNVPLVKPLNLIVITDGAPSSFPLPSSNDLGT